MQAYGRLTLTNYLTQNVIAFVLLICIKPDWPLSWYVLTGVVVYILQVYFSVWWTSKYHFGLMEWCWRCLSYGKVFPLKTGWKPILAFLKHLSHRGSSVLPKTFPIYRLLS